MKLTNAEKHAAFYQAAENIEARPDLYDFCGEYVGDEWCPACMWGHVGRVAKLPSQTVNKQVAKYFDFKSTVVLYEGTPLFAQHAANHLRDFANHHWPQAQHDFTPSKLSLAEIVGEVEGVAG